MRIKRIVSLLVFLALPQLTRAQGVSVMGSAIPLVTRADPTATRGPLTEGYLTQPVIMASAWDGFLRGVATINLEGLTIKRGELSTGGYGETYVDRRHPHAFVHELLAGAQNSFGGTDASVFFGRGFAPFGSDDPMVRPFEKFPINHHLSQILERVVAVGAIRRGPVIAEVGTFNGDEPTGPGSAPTWKRFGDSWSARLTVVPIPSLETSASIARVKSPEVVSGAGLDQSKSSFVARWNHATESSLVYGLVEYAKTGERDDGALITSLSSLLGETAVCKNGIVLGARLERTDRAEEEQSLDPFRTPRPTVDLANLGVSRWTVLTGSLSSPAIEYHWLSGRPFVEVAHLSVAPGSPPGIFSAQNRYGSSTMWMLSAGIRLHAGMMHDRMGRYGAAALVDDGMEMGTSAHGPSSHDMPDMPGMTMPMTHRQNRCAL